MKQLLFFLLLFVYLGSGAQQNGNFCQLLYKAFNSADQGFPFLRPGTIPDSIKSYRINEDTLKNYGFNKGSIIRNTNLRSKLHEGKTYTAWTLLLTSEKKYGDRNWADIKEGVTQTMGKFLRQISDGCFSQQLKWSDLISPEGESSSYLVSYFYPKQISVPENTADAKIEELLSETTYIKVFLSAPWMGGGFYLNYSVNGIKYN
jgi:hypothetical protein